MSSTPVARLHVWLALAILLALSVDPHVAAQQPVFRSAVELIAVDVQVIDSDGTPIDKIGPEKFEVSIQGRRRKVVSAQFVRHTELAPVAGRAAPPALAQSIDPIGPGRTVILAVDAGSFEAGATKAPMDAAKNFILNLAPDDALGLFVFPDQAWIAPSTGRAAVSARLSQLVGEKDAIRSYFGLSVHDIVDISAENQNPFAFFMQRTVDPLTATEQSPVLKIARRQCPADEPGCPARIYSEGIALVAQLERGVEQSLSGLDSMLRILSGIPGRKAIVLVTGGLLVSDRPDGRPDVGNVARLMGQYAARANATVYTVHVDQTSYNLGAAVKKKTDSVELARDRAMNSNWLEDFSRSAGGQRINVVPGGAADFAFDRILRETSAYYLLGVEPADADRDGKPRELKVKVDSRDSTVRNRQWVVIPPKK